MIAVDVVGVRQSRFVYCAPRARASSSIPSLVTGEKIQIRFCWFVYYDLPQTFTTMPARTRTRSIAMQEATQDDDDIEFEVAIGECVYQNTSTTYYMLTN